MLNNEIIVSIHMITYNHEQYISQAIEGVIIQKCKFPIELVIGEDFSVDNTRSICEEYAQKYSWIKLLPSEKNLGAMANSIRTFQACIGKYIAICEGDDYWTDPLKLQKQVDFLEENPDYGLIHTEFNQKDESSQKIIKNYNESSNNKIPDGQIFKDLLGDNWIIHTQTVVMCKHLVNEYIDFHLRHKDIVNKWRYGDIPLYLFIANKSKIKYLNISTAVYLVRVESACHSKSRITNLKNQLSLYNLKLFFLKSVNLKDLDIKTSLTKKKWKILLRISTLDKSNKFTLKILWVLTKKKWINLFDIFSTIWWSF